jgi:hypothetical protein
LGAWIESEAEFEVIHFGEVRQSSKWNSFFTEDKEGSWISINFKRNRVSLTACTVCTIGSGSYPHCTKSWRLERSEDEEGWAVVDSEEEVGGMSTPNTTKTFKVSATPPSRFFRLTQIGRNSNGNFRLGIGSMDFFGTLFLAS